MNLSFGTPWRYTVLCSFVHRLWRNKLRRSFYWSERSQNKGKAIEYCAPSPSRKHEPNKRFHSTNYEQGRFWATHFDRNNMRSDFPSPLFICEAKSKLFSLYQSYDFRANSLIEVICLKNLAKPLPKKQNVPFPLTCFAQNRLIWLGSLL